MNESEGVAMSLSKGHGVEKGAPVPGTCPSLCVERSHPGREHDEAEHGCYCWELCEMGPTCPAANAGLPKGCWRFGEPQERRAVAREVAQFNDLIPVGTPVLYWPALREGEGVASKTRTRAWLLGDHTPVVMVEGYPGGIALSHVCPIPPAEPRA